MKVGRIAYTNTEPFFHAWDSSTFDLLPGSPQELADAARKGEVVAGPLPLVECWALEDQFENLGDWGIAARERCRSVFVLSQIPFSELDHVMMGVTKESSTSVVLCETLIKMKYGHHIRMRKGLQSQDPAWLVIGDQALQMVNNPTAQAWPYITDLASEWWDWKHLPFVFARWVVRRDLAPAFRLELENVVAQSLSKGLGSLDTIASKVAPELKLSPTFVKSYLSEFLYKMTPETHNSENEFRRLVKEGVYL